MQASSPLFASENQSHPVGESIGLGVRLVVSPSAGRLRHLPPARFEAGKEWVSRGQAVALVENGSVSIEVRSPIEGKVAGVLVRDGEPVAQGQPLVWLDDSPIRPVREPRGKKP